MLTLIRLRNEYIYIFFFSHFFFSHFFFFTHFFLLLQVPSSGKSGPAELSGYIEYGDVISAVNGISLQSMSFDDACDAFSSSSWPRMILFQKPIENIKTKRVNDILTQYLILQRRKKTECIT